MVRNNSKNKPNDPLSDNKIFNICIQYNGDIDSLLWTRSGVQEKLGVMNKGTVYALWDYEAQNQDELSFGEGDAVTILRRQDDSETEWWWARLEDNEGYVPRNLLGVMTKYTICLTQSSFSLLIGGLRYIN